MTAFGEEMKRRNEDRTCPHCHSRAPRKHCKKCMRRMCEDCISIGEMGDTCGLCKDREDGLKRYNRLVAQGKELPDFDEWYDQNA